MEIVRTGASSRRDVWPLALCLVSFLAGALCFGFFPDFAGWFSDRPFSFGVLSQGNVGWVPCLLFLLDSLFFLLSALLFGLTFLGIFVVPAAVAARGFTLGAALLDSALALGPAGFLQSWMTYLPSALCCAVLISFAGILFERESTVSAGSCVLLFGAAAMLDAVFAAACYCIALF